MNYKKPLQKCYDILKDSDDINYLLCVCDSTEKENKASVGGQAWNINTDDEDNETGPDFTTMVGNMIESYVDSNGYDYISKVKFVRQLCNEIIEHLTSKGDKDGEVEE